MDILEEKYNQVSALETMLLIRELVEEIAEIREQLDEHQELLEKLRLRNPGVG
jgi:hypothetical protein